MKAEAGIGGMEFKYPNGCMRAAEVLLFPKGGVDSEEEFGGTAQGWGFKKGVKGLNDFAGSASNYLDSVQKEPAFGAKVRLGIVGWDSIG